MYLNDVGLSHHMEEVQLKNNVGNSNMFNSLYLHKVNFDFEMIG